MPKQQANQLPIRGGNLEIVLALCLKPLEGGVHKGIRTNRARPRFHYGFYLYPEGGVENLAGKKAEDNIVGIDNDTRLDSLRLGRLCLTAYHNSRQ